MVVDQAVLMYESETWLMTPHIGGNLGGFRHRVAFRLTGQQPQRGINVIWRYPLLAEAMEEAGLH